MLTEGEEYDIEESDFGDDDDDGVTSSEDEGDTWDPSKATPFQASPYPSPTPSKQRRRRPASGSDANSGGASGSRREMSGDEASVLAAMNAERAAAGQGPLQRLTVAALKESLVGKVVDGVEWKGAGKKKVDLLQDYK